MFSRSKGSSDTLFLARALSRRWSNLRGSTKGFDGYARGSWAFARFGEMQEQVICFSTRGSSDFVDAGKCHAGCQNEPQMTAVEVDMLHRNVGSSRELLLVVWIPAGTKDKG